MMSAQPAKQLVVDDDEVDPAAPFTLAPNRVALVAADARATFGYAPFFADIAEAADAAGCDAVVYALAPRPIPVMAHSQLFGRSRRVATVILEVTEPNGNAVIEVWRRDVRIPHRFRQRLVRSQDSDWSKRALMSGLAARTFGPTMFLACGEVNIITTHRGSSDVIDRFGFLPRLAGRRLIVNSSHTYMVRPEAKDKRRRYSEDGRVVLSVWNPGYHAREVKLPWQAFVDGDDVSGLIEPIKLAEPLIHIGVFGLGSVS